jgi:diguanylate cyclase (GGDEF)-like protein
LADASSRPADLRNRKIQAAAGVVPFCQAANVASTIVVGLFATPTRVGAVRAEWIVAMCATALFAMIYWVPSATGRRPGARSDVVLMLAVVVTQGSLLGWFAYHVLPVATPTQTPVLVATFAGVLGGGAMGLNPIRSVGLAWVAATVAALEIALIHAYHGVDVITFQLMLYGLALSAGIIYLSRSFELRCRAELAAANDRQVVSLLLDDFEGGAHDWLWETDGTGRLSHVSNRLAECTRRPREQLQQLSLPEVLREAEADGTVEGGRALEELEAHLVARRPFRDIVVQVEQGGEPRWWSLSGKPNTGPSGSDGAWRGVGSDITEAMQQQAEILRLADTDALTGLGNRRALARWLEAACAGCRNDRVVALGLLDLDNFKSVNDTLGHPVGDALLAALADRLTEALRPGESCARMGGDEFAIVITGAVDTELPVRRYEQLLRVLDAPFVLGDNLVELRGSLGHANHPTDAHTPDELVLMADLAMYAAKDAGRDQIRPFDPRLATQARVRSQCLQELRHALDHDELEVQYQPQADAETGVVTGFEALLRWHHPVRGLVMPGEFIPVAEESGLIVPIGDWLTREACRSAAGWPADVRVSINVSPTQLRSAGIVDTFRRALADNDLPPTRVEVEITESSLVGEFAAATVAELADLGLSIAIDDFGTGYSSLAMLRALPLDRVKIDRAFVTPLDTEPGPGPRAMVAAILQIADALGLETIAEGVESTAQRETLAALGCDQLQGYLLAHALGACEVRSFLERPRRWSPATARLQS